MGACEGVFLDNPPGCDSSGGATITVLEFEVRSLVAASRGTCDIRLDPNPSCIETNFGLHQHPLWRFASDRDLYMASYVPLNSAAFVPTDFYGVPFDSIFTWSCPDPKILYTDNAPQIALYANLATPATGPGDWRHIGPTGGGVPYWGTNAFFVGWGAVPRVVLRYDVYGGWRYP
jgi:hypothetical protein